MESQRQTQILHFRTTNARHAKLQTTARSGPFEKKGERIGKADEGTNKAVGTVQQVSVILLHIRSTFDSATNMTLHEIALIRQVILTLLH